MGDWQQRVETHRLFHDQPRRLGWFCQIVLSQKTLRWCQWSRWGSWSAFGSRHHSLNYTTNQILNGKARTATYFFFKEERLMICNQSHFGIFNNPFIQIEYEVWMYWVRRQKTITKLQIFAPWWQSYFFRYNKWLLKKNSTLFLYLFTSYCSVWI